jgi:hypothetical protein
MREVSVKVQTDYLQRMITIRNPVLAVAELIWNALDAEAQNVRVNIDTNELGGITKIVVADDGHGIEYDDAISSFEKLGGSWKKYQNHSKHGTRRLHGKKGQGRFQAFALGGSVKWNTRYKLNNIKVQYSIIGQRTRLGTFSLDEEPKQCKQSGTGTVVTIEGVDNGIYSLKSRNALQTITEQFALYLRQYPDVSIFYDDHEIDPSDVEERLTEYEIDSLETSGRLIESNLTIIEWKTSTERWLYLCDPHGFALEELKAGIQAPGFNFTAYLKSEYFKELEEQNALLEDLDPNLKKIVGSARNKLREHFRKRAAESASKIVEEWKEEKIYPYVGEAKNIIEETERQVFDVVALSLHDYLPDFQSADRKNKKLTFALLKQAVEESPQAVQRILEEVLDLPKEKQEEFAELLEKTSLTAIINASKVVADRLDFLRGLETLVFEPKSRKELLERSQLHKILADHTWIFGEEFNLTVNDQSLTEVLNIHLHELGRELEKDSEPVLREDGSVGIVDLMLSRSVPQPRADEREHLVIELKRPKVPVDAKVANQIESYAFAVADDERFRDTNTKWVFWAISNEIEESVRKKSNQRNRPRDLLYEDDEGRIKIWVKTWGQVIQNCKARLEFFQRELKYSAERDSGLAYLRKVHEKYLPTYLVEEDLAEEVVEEESLVS